MSGSLSQLGNRTEAHREFGRSPVVILTIAGLAGGLLTAMLKYPIEHLSTGSHVFLRYSLGAPLGAMLGISLAWCGVLGGFKGLSQAILFVPLSGMAYFVSQCVAVGTELAVTSGKPMSMGDVPSYSLWSMFAGGFLGGFLVLYGVLLLVYPGQLCVLLMFKVLFSSILTGLLAIVAYSLGPYLDVAVWSLVHELGLTPPTETFQNARGDVSHVYSLFVVWQTGTAFLLGLILRSLHSPSKTRSAIQ